MGALFSVLGFLSKLGSALLAYFHDKEIKDAQVAKDQARNATGGLSEIQRAGQARDAVDGQLAADPDSVRRPDNHSAARGGDGIS